MNTDEPIVYIKDRELLYIEGLKQAGLATEWHTNLGFVKEDGDVGLYTHPPTKAAPMPLEKRAEAYMELEGALGPDAHLMSFLSGICEAEKHHGILDTE